jgi:glycosyltransferase involved in cell wall biosynthesis
MRKKLDILYVTHDSLLEGIGMSQIVPVVIGLSKAGWHVGVISCEKSPETIPLQKVLTDEGISWEILKFGKVGAIGGLGRLIRIYLKLPNARAHHCRGDLAATACALRLRSNILWDVRGLWIDQKLVIGSINKNLVIVWLARKLEWMASISASSVTTLTKAVYPVLKKRNPRVSNFHQVIPTCTDLKKFAFKDKMPVERSLLLSGVFNDYYDLPKTKSFISELKKVTPIIVTWCHGHESKRTTLGVGEDVIKILRQGEMPTEVSKASFGLAICKTNIGDSLAGVMPTKIAEFLAVGRPVLVSEGIGDLEELLLTTKTGVILRESNSIAISELIQLLDDPGTPQRCRALAESHFSMEIAIQKYDKIFRTLLKKF